MHELGIVFHIIRSIEDVGKKNNLAKVQSVTMEFGEVSGVVDDIIRDCWHWATAKHELLKESEMQIEHPLAITHCDDCGRRYPTVEHGRICPYCHSEKTFLLCGREINIKEIVAC